MQGGLTRRQLTFREIFEAGIAFLAVKNVLFAFFDSPVGQCGCSTNASGGLATLDDGSTDQVIGLTVSPGTASLLHDLSD
jgi:hypothetical protein